ncbi:valine--tRNA ligase [Candidatus Saccharibacteria bacterium]|nr:valine--tRNA ligase [Candidatus Saccharibacteria bacterium]
MMELPKTYESKNYEADIYQRWEDADAFKPKPAKGEPFSIVLPPPNATGTLHLGHTMMIAIEDLMVRYWRMKGRETVWVPGTDHAAIATENVVIKKLIDEKGIADPRAELGREGLLEEIRKFVEESRDTIRNQVRAVGASVDWSRERYTMDEGISRVVSDVFVNMYEDEVVYRGNRIVNWDPKLQTTVSDDEVDHKEETTTLYTLKYGPFEIATARPETKFGDKYVVVHPDDERYKDWKHGDTFEADWINGMVSATLIKDEAIDPEFGTGAMTITPWHDPTDFEIAERHDLTKEQIIDQQGNMLEIAGKFAGQSIEQARAGVIEILDKKGLLVSSDDNYTHSLALNSRGKGVIEPQIMLQWFIDVNKPAIKWHGKQKSLKEIMKSVVEDEEIQIIPEHFKKTYYSWIDNLHDWCISRQIWWGHRIPVWYRDGEMYVGTRAPIADPKDDSNSKWVQEPDTLDTWFSAAMWSWTTLLDPERLTDENQSLKDILKHSPDFQRYHPNTMLETGYDIIFFWVARMILMTTYAVGDVPFENVYLHGMVRDRNGSKMSKSNPTTAIDPLEIIPEYGADALRLAMTIGMSPGNDTRLYKEKIAGYRNFCNKLWNVARYCLTDVEADYVPSRPIIKTEAEKWIISRLDETIDEVSSQIENHRHSDAGQAVYHFLWDDFANWYIETSKVQENPDLLLHILENILKLAHPFAPFVTETIWQQLPYKDDLLITASWPLSSSAKKVNGEFEQIKLIVTEIRNLKTDLDISDTTLYYKKSDFLDENRELIKKLSGVKDVKKVVDGRGLHLTQTSVEAWLDVEENATRNYLMKLISHRLKINKVIASIEKRLNNKEYVNKAPEHIIEESKQNLEDNQKLADRLTSRIEAIEESIQEF